MIFAQQMTWIDTTNTLGSFKKNICLSGFEFYQPMSMKLLPLHKGP